MKTPVPKKLNFTHEKEGKEGGGGGLFNHKKYILSTNYVTEIDK